MESYSSALASNPKLASAHYNAARVYSQTGDVASCLSHLDQVLELAPELAEDAAEDEHLGWALKMKRMREGKGPEDSRDDAF